MDSQVYQLSQLTCNYCGQTGISPRTETYEDRYAQEMVTEAVWTCHRCGQRFSAGVVSREKIEK